MQELITKIVEKITNEKLLSLEKMTRGIANEVYTASLTTKKVVIRLNTDSSKIRGSEKYTVLFRSKGIIVPEIIASDYSMKEFPFAYQVLTYIEGEDLGTVIKSMDKKELIGLAREIAFIIKTLSEIPTNGKFGWVGSEEKNMKRSWLEVLEDTLNDVIRRNKKTGIVGLKYIEIFKKILVKYKEYFKNAPSIFYYDDMNSKNVLINHGKFAGLIDLDWVMYGDFLNTVGMIRTSWYGSEHGEIYSQAVMNELNLNQQQKEMVDIYALLEKIFWLSEKKENNDATERDRVIINKLIEDLRI